VEASSDCRQPGRVTLSRVGLQAVVSSHTQPGRVNGRDESFSTCPGPQGSSSG
jgi:hypothetical protein